MTSTVTDVEKALINTRELEEYWREYGWESLQLEDEVMSDKILEIYPLVERDIKVKITVKLEGKHYTVPIEDVSALHINDCLIIDTKNLYPDWEERIQANLGMLVTIHSIDHDWNQYLYLGQDGNIRVLKKKDKGDSNEYHSSQVQILKT